MKLFSRLKPEAIVYLVLWAILFVVPVVSIQFHYSETDGQSLPWRELRETWIQFLILFVAFLLHNYFLAPLIVYKRRYLHYFAAIAVLIACFVTVQCMHRPDFGHGGPHPDFSPHHYPERIHHEHQVADACGDDSSTPSPVAFTDDSMAVHAKGHRPPMDFHQQEHSGGRPPIIFGQQDIISVIWLILMLGMNVGVKMFFSRREDEARMASLEKKNLEQQLAFLRYQINPHFLMNTLNNIHALIDIDPEEAKETILGFSKILRFVLYEGDRQMVPLDCELGFLQNYIELMAMRVADKVDLVVKLPSNTSDIQVPPLLFITFVENAFKHGVSYQQHSFIDISGSVEDGRINFQCSNSRPATHPTGKQGGVGLKNIRRRLELIYGKDFKLDIEENDATYNVMLSIPAEPKSITTTHPIQH